jgi:hypothetical protein
MAADPVFAIRGWDLERFDPQYVIEMIGRAHQAGMNTISLSHEIVMNAEEILLDWHRYQHLQRFCQEAHKYGMKVYFWNHQINNPPEELVSRDGNARSLDFDNEKLWKWLYERYQRVADRVPEVDGIILSLTESEWQVHRDPSDPQHFNSTARIISRLTPAQRMAKVINTIRNSLHARGKSLIVRDFLRSPREIDAFLEALRATPDDVIVYTKCVPNDWQYCYPPHPLLGKVAPHRQVMELDLYNETGGFLDSVMLAPEYYRAQLRLARDRKLVGAIARVDDGFATNRDTPAEFNVFAYNRLMQNPDADVEPLWREFFEPYYGPQAAAVAIDCLKRSFELTCAISYTLGFWTGAGGKARVAYTDGHLVRHSSALWSDDPRYRQIEKLLLESGPETIRRTVEEKSQAAQLAGQCLAELDAARASFAPDKFLELRGYFEEFQQKARIAEVRTRAYFALRWYRNTRSPQAKAAADAALAECQAFLKAPLPEPSAYVRTMDESRRQRFYFLGLPEFTTDLVEAMAQLENAVAP